MRILILATVRVARAGSVAKAQLADGEGTAVAKRFADAPYSSK